jgi:hypothetical protein
MDDQNIEEESPEQHSNSIGINEKAIKDVDQINKYEKVYIKENI